VSKAESASLSLFKVLVADKTPLYYGNAVDGFITDFVPSAEQLKLLRDTCVALPITTLFSVEERKNADPYQLIYKQLLHYVEVYGLESPGLFNLEVTSGRLATLTFIKAVTLGELAKLVQGLIYANRPIATDDIELVKCLIDSYKLPYDINLVLNNEAKIALFDPITDRFKNGDDAVRYICYQATTKALLIKSKQVIQAVQKNPVGTRFLENHRLPLAQVFNRHKQIILACKHPATRSSINAISRLSKTQHKPLHEPISKRFISETMKKGVHASVLGGISLRDKFKYLNLIEYKLLGLPYDSFNIRNGKVWDENNRPILSNFSLVNMRGAVLTSIKEQLSLLKDKRILVDPNVDYGLPISRKQALGNLPYGTRVSTIGNPLSAGIYWHNDAWLGKKKEFYNSSTSIDLDLSAIDKSGQRTGWGMYSGYSKTNPIMFSGDMTDATNGATEFLTTKATSGVQAGLMVNIYRGPEQCEAELVVGTPSGKDWQDRTLIREKITLQSKESIIGFIKNGDFIVYSGRLSNSRISYGKHPVLDKAFGQLWTVEALLDAADIPYDTAPKLNVTYDHDLRYQSFTIDKLETMLFG